MEKSESGGGLIWLGRKKIRLAAARRLTRSRRQAAPAANVSRTMGFALGAGLFRRTHVGVGFNVAPLLFHNATQLTLHSFKSVVDDFFERFVSAVIHLSFIGHKLVARRHRHVDPAPVWVPFLMGVIGLLDSDIAAVDVITKSLESFCIIQNEIVDMVRFFQTPIRYLNRQLHNYLDTTALLAIEGTKISVPAFNSNLPQRPEMADQSGRFDLHQIRFHVFDNSLSNTGRQQIYDRRVDFRRRRKRPAVVSILRDNFRDLVGQLFLNPPVGFRGQLRALGN